MKNYKTLLLIVITNLLLFSCNRIHENKLNNANYANSSTFTDSKQPKKYDNHAIDKEYAPDRYEFCQCVLATDSVKKLIQEISDFESSYAEQLLQRLEYIRNNCRSVIKPINQQNAEEQRQYIKQIKECLKDSSIIEIDLTFFN